MSGINWGLAQPQQNSFMGSFERGLAFGDRVRQRREQREVRNALQGFAENPNDSTHLNALMPYRPELALKLKDRQRDARFSSALGEYYEAGRDNIITPVEPKTARQEEAAEPFELNAVDPTIFDGMDEAGFSEAAESLNMIEDLAKRADSPEKWDSVTNRLAAQDPQFQRYVGQFGQRGAILANIAETKSMLSERQAGLTAPVVKTPSRQDAALDNLYDIDPLRAEKFRNERSKQKLADVERNLKIMQAVDSGYDLAIETLSSATDEESYQRSLQLIDQRFAPLGVNIRERAPENYPGPDGIRQMLQSSMAAKEQIAAQDRQLRLENDIADDAADNARADRNTDNLIATRSQRAGTAARRESRLGKGRRGGGKRKGRKPVKMKAGEPSITTADGRTQVARKGKWVDAK